MDSTPPTSKRMKTRVVGKGGRLENWFSGEGEQIQKYLHETSRKVIKPKVDFLQLDEVAKAYGSKELVEGENAEEIYGNVCKYISKFGKSLLHKSSICW